MTDEAREFALLCPHCGEENPPEFPVCWSCHGDQPGPEATPREEPLAAPGPPAPDPEAVAARQKRLAIEVAVVLIVIWLPAFSGGISNAFEPNPPMDWSMALWGLVHGAGILALVWYLAWLDGDWRRFLGLLGPRVADVPWAAATFVALQLAGASAQWIARVLGFETTSLDMPRYRQDVQWIAPLDFLLWAFVEEVVYRAYLWNRFSALSRRPALSIVAAAVLFAAMHGYPPEGSLAVFFMGLALGWIFRFRRSLWPVVLGHWGFNLFVSA
jgi:membrane protease YdiL (CAAX protease family)